MMERWVFLTARLMDRASSKTGEDTSWEGGDQNPLGLGAPQALWMGLGLQGGHLLAVNPEEGLAVSTFACAWPPKLQYRSCSGSRATQGPQEAQPRTPFLSVPLYEGSSSFFELSQALLSLSYGPDFFGHVRARSYWP